jgi:hypothetical protein
MEVNKDTGGYLFPGPTMKRICSLCLAEYPYQKVKRYAHPLQLCEKCQDVLIDLNLTATSLLRR